MGLVEYLILNKKKAPKKGALFNYIITKLECKC